MNSPPRVILVGAKGSGKSKLVSSVCGIYLGTSTSCPVEWRLLPTSNKWSAEVSVAYFHSSWSGKIVLDSSRRIFLSSQNPVSTPHELWSLVRRAEILAFSPSQKLSKVLSMSEEAIDHEYFNILLSSSHSRGVVYVDMQCPGYISSEITIVDLPGLTWTGYSSIITYIHKLTCYYTLGKERTIVALFPHATDQKYEIQALQFFKRRGHDMGQITMVIGIAHTDGQVNPIWLNAMDGSTKIPYRFVYFLASGPHAPTALSSSIILEKRQEEAAYFLFSKPWSAQTSKDNFGIPNILKEWDSLWASSSQSKVSWVEQTGSWIEIIVVVIFFVTFLSYLCVQRA